MGNQGVTVDCSPWAPETCVSAKELSALLTWVALSCRPYYFFPVGMKSLLPLATSPKPLFVWSLFVHLPDIYLCNIFPGLFSIVGLELMRSLPDCQTHWVSPGLGITGVMGPCLFL